MAQLYFVVLFHLSLTNSIVGWNSSEVLCPFFKSNPDFDIEELVGNWMTVYSQPRAVSCFTLNIRATTEMEREGCSVKYGSFNGRVRWELCRLELESPLGKHYLQGSGRGGVLENIIVATTEQDEYYLVEQSADQWALYGRRGSQLLLMRDCGGDAVAVFARAPFWPSTTELYAALHRSGIAPLAERVLCLPVHSPAERCSVSRYIADMRL